MAECINLFRYLNFVNVLLNVRFLNLQSFLRLHQLICEFHRRIRLFSCQFIGLLNMICFWIAYPTFLSSFWKSLPLLILASFFIIFLVITFLQAFNNWRSRTFLVLLFFLFFQKFGSNIFIWFFILHLVVPANQRRFWFNFQNSWTSFKIYSRIITFIIVVSTLVSALIIDILILYLSLFFFLGTVKISWTLLFLFQTNILNNSIYFLYCWLRLLITCVKWFWRLGMPI